MRPVWLHEFANFTFIFGQAAPSELEIRNVQPMLRFCLSPDVYGIFAPQLRIQKDMEAGAREFEFTGTAALSRIMWCVLFVHVQCQEGSYFALNS